jgi:Tfp pilus assembly protein PilF
MSEAATPVEIFCSYAHEDEEWREKLERHVSVLQHLGLVSLWHDRLIIPGTDWAHAIDTHLETASIILLLISADFLASNYCVSIEMKRAMERLDASEVLVIPILIHQVDWYDAPFARLQALPKDAKPLAAWQDEEMALTDVTAGIRRAVETLPLLAASAPRAALPTIWNIPYPRNPFFLGRESELAQVHQRLQANQTAAVSQAQAISGLGGIGKTQLALEYAYRYHQDYTAVLWARAESIEGLISSYVALATVLRLPEREAKEQEVTVQAVKTWLQKHRSWLLILDNADELMLLSDFLPPGLEGHLLLTTRAAATGRLAHRIEIETWRPEHGALFLLQRANLLTHDATLEQASSQEERDRALQISQELGGLPLALDQAGAYLEETGTSLSDYWHIYQQHRADLLRKRGGLVADHPEPVATTWALSFQRVEEKMPVAADLLRLCTFLSPDAIPEEILRVGTSMFGPVLIPLATDAFLLNQAIEALRAYSLVRRDPEGKVLSIHRLIQAVLQDMMGEEEQYKWAERAMHAVNATFSNGGYNTHAQCERLLPQALAAIQNIEQYQIIIEDAGRLLYETASYLRDRARYAEAEPLYLQALHIREHLLGSHHPDVALSLNGLAILYSEQGKYTKAEPLYLQALHIREHLLGSQHPDVALSLNGLAISYYQQGKYAKAESLYLQVLHIREQQLGSQHPQIASLLNNLAVLYYQQGKYTEAEPLYLQALHIREQQLGSQHPQIASLLNNLALVYCQESKYVEAEPLYLQTLRIWEQHLGLEHPLVAFPLNNLALLYYQQGKYAEAEPLSLRALHIREQQLSLEHPDVAYPLNGLANLYNEQGKYVEAESLYLRALHIREQTLGPEHTEVAETMNDLARFREAQDNSDEANVWYARALTIREQVLGVQHPKTIETRTRLITLLHALGQHEEAALLELVQAES